MVVCGNKTYSLGLLNSVDSIRSQASHLVSSMALCLTRQWRLCAAASRLPKNMTCSLLSPLAGSAMDTAKAIFLHKVDVDGDIIYTGATTADPPQQPAVCHPHHCGTGSESTDIGVVLIRKQITSIFLSNPFAGPDAVAILDLPYC